MRKGSSRFPDSTRQSGGGRIGILHKPSKKVKALSSVGGMDKLPKKLLDDGHTVNFVSVPRKLRSVLNKRYSDPLSPNLTNAIVPSTDGNKKGKLDPNEQLSVMKNEEEAIAGLLALAGHDNIHEINLNSKIHDLNESRNILDVKKDCQQVTVGNEPRKRCSSHIYICQIIKKLKLVKGKMVISYEEAKTETTLENVMQVNTGINLNEAVKVGKIVAQDPPSGCGAHSYFGNPYCDPSQWSRPMFPKQQMWMNMNPLMYKPPHSGSYVQGSLHNVQVSNHRPSSGYDENGVMFRVDNPPTLKLALH